MVHTRMSALGWVIGGSETVVRSLLDALGPEGTLMAYASWADHVYTLADWPEEHREAYLAEPPLCDPATGEVDPDYGRIPERMRTWPGALRSAHPEASVVAVGPRASWLTESHEDGYGAGSPFARLVEAGGQVLMLGAPLETVTLLHHAEAIASAPGKRHGHLRDRAGGRHHAVVHRHRDLGRRVSVRVAGARRRRVRGHRPGCAGRGHRGARAVGAAECHLFPARELTEFAVAWIEARFG